MNINTDFSVFFEYLPFLLPLLIVQLVLAVISIIHVLRHPNYRFGNRPLWICIVLFVQFFGPLIYFIWGREEA